jgi:hypothetical protein
MAVTFKNTYEVLMKKMIETTVDRILKHNESTGAGTKRCKPFIEQHPRVRPKERYWHSRKIRRPPFQCFLWRACCDQVFRGREEIRPMNSSHRPRVAYCIKAADKEERVQVKKIPASESIGDLSK